MNKKKVRVEQLAREAGMDKDEALLRLWDANLEHIVSPGHILKGRELESAREALGLVPRRRIASIEYWCARLALSAPEIVELLEAEGVGRPTRTGILSKRQISSLERVAANTSVSGVVQVIEPTHEKTVPERELFQWEVVGKETPLRYLSVHDVVAIHEELVRDFSDSSDPISPAGVKDQALLESAVSRPHTALGNVLKYPTVEMAAAAILTGLVHNHAFHNGNKRTALVSTIVFLDENRVILECDDDEIFRLVLQLANHSLLDSEMDFLVDREVLHVAKWLRDRTRWIEKGDRPVSWRRLSQILVSFGCTIEEVGSGPVRYEIRRLIEETGRRLGRAFSRRRTLSSTLRVIDAGRDVPVAAIKRIRAELELDEEHGVDSLAFYIRGEPIVSEFIPRYRKLLKRLARL